MAIIYPSLIAADLLNLQKDINQMDPYCHGYHIDVMDNHFVPNLTWGPAFIYAIARATEHKLWIHLMVDKPEQWVDNLSLSSGNIISFHFETIGQNIHIIDRIQKKNCMASIAIKPKTNVEEIFPLLNIIDQVLVMSVEPGFSGQSFIKDMADKVVKLQAFRIANKLNFRIGIDGGINKDNIWDLKMKGVDDFAVANAIFGTSDPVASLKELNELAL
jgi:ribulose-phosphate 3-epimerase